MFTIQNLLIITLLLPLLGSIFLSITPSSEHSLIRSTSLNFSCITFIFSLFLWFFFNKSLGSFQFVTKFFWIPNLNLNIVFGIDGISIFFIILTTLLIPLCFLTSWTSINKNLKEFFLAFLIMEFFLIIVFCVLDLLLFYIFFESVLIPMFLIIGIWGSRERKIRAAYFFFCILY